MTHHLQRNRSTRRLTVESLESRSLLAGNVLVSVSDGVLNVTGDDAANDVQIRQIKQTYTGEWPGLTVEISGKSLHSNHQTTTINGESAPLIVSGVKSGAEIHLGDGDNALRIANIPSDSSVPSSPQIPLPGRISIASGSGADDIRLFLNNGKQIFVNSGDGEDYVQVKDSTVKNLTLNSDPIRAEGMTQVGAKDRIEISRLRLRGAVIVTSGLGMDDVKFRGSCHIDGSLLVDVGAGADQLRFDGASTTSNLMLNGETTIIGGDGNDGLSFNTVSVNGSFTAELGEGGDILIGQHLSSTVALVVDFGGGSDTASFLSVDLFGVDFDGGSGADKIQRGSGTNLGTEAIVNFESDQNL